MTTSAIYYLDKPFVYPTESLIGRFLEAGRGWDTILAKSVPALVDEQDPVIVEVGANIGASLMQILAAKPEARVVCFEPSDRFRPYLLRNVRFAGAEDRVEVHPSFLGAQNEARTLYVSASSASASAPDRDQEKRRGEQQIVATTLDSEMGERRVDFLKVDTDGFEFEVFRGAERTLRRWRPALHFEFATQLIDEPLKGLEWLKELGYERLLCLTAVGELIGTTTEPEQAIEWAEGTKHGYCDIVTIAKGSPTEAAMEGLVTTLR